MLKTGESATIIIAHTGVTGGAAAVLSLATAEGGRLAMVAARYIEERYLNPLREKWIKREEEAMEKSRKEGSEQGREQGREQGSADANAIWEAWNERRLAAEAKGEPFDEPTPATLRDKDRSLTMAQLRATRPYIWVTWLPRLLSLWWSGSC